MTKRPRPSWLFLKDLRHRRSLNASATQWSSRMETLQHLWPPVRLTLELATIGILTLLVVAPPLGWWLARSKRSWKEVIATIVSLPLVMPPTVLGFSLLIALGPDGPGGAIASLWGARTLAFTFQGLVIGCI